MKTIVITGGTRGIGYGLADAFLSRGQQVVLCGRSAESTVSAVQRLAAQYGAEDVFGQTCDVGDAEQVQALWDAALGRFGRVDVWINNAAISTPYETNFWDLPPDRLDAVVRTNLLGTMYGCRVAIRGMLAQGSGQVYLMEGFGSNGMVTRGLTTYGATKAGLTYLTKALIAETEGTPVSVNYLNPGMVYTDLLTGGKDAEAYLQENKVVGILADPVEPVTAYLAERILTNDARGTRVAWLTTPKILWRFLSARLTERGRGR